MRLAPGFTFNRSRIKDDLTMGSRGTGKEDPRIRAIPPEVIRELVDLFVCSKATVRLNGGAEGSLH
jgi:hypothetical protein